MQQREALQRREALTGTAASAGAIHQPEPESASRGFWTRLRRWWTGDDMNVQRGYRIGLFTTIVLLVDASTAQVRNATRAEDLVAHAVFAGIPAVAAIVAYQWQSIRSAWVFVVPAAICMLAGVRGFEQFWAYALAFAIAGGIGVVSVVKW